MMIFQDKWCKMSEDVRKAHLKKFHQMSVINATQEPSPQEISPQEPGGSITVLPSLSVDCVSVAANCNLPKDLVQNIWEKASGLVNTRGAMAPAPGHPSEARTVQSTSKTGFHLVISGSSGKFICDCANYHSSSLCSHSVAVPEIKHNLLSGTGNQKHHQISLNSS